MTLPALMAQSLEALAVDKPQDETTTLDTVVVSGKKPVAKPLTRTDINASDVQKQLNNLLSTLPSNVAARNNTIQNFLADRHRLFS